MGKSYQEVPTQIVSNDLQLKVAGFFAILGLVIFGGVMYLFYRVLEKFEPSTIHIWAAFLTTAVLFGTPLVAFLGFYFGKVEARGFMAGADVIMERVFGRLVDVVQVRDQSRVTVKNEAPQPNANPIYYMSADPNGYNYPPITERSESHRGEVLNLE